MSDEIKVILYGDETLNMCEMCGSIEQTFEIKSNESV